MSKDSSEGFEQVVTLVDLLRFRATHQPDDIVYQFLPDGEAQTASLTCGELDRAARAVASLLSSLGCHGKPVLILYPSGLDYIAAFFGCAYAGAIAVPAYPPRPNRSIERLQVMIQDAGAQVALTDSRVLKGLEQRFSECPALKSLQWLATDTLSETDTAAWQNPAVSPDTLALLQYTSGSTGNPKGVKVSHGNLIHNSARISEFFKHSRESRGVTWLPPYHDMGLVGGIVQPLYLGTSIALMPPIAFLQKPLRWLQAIARYGATSSGGPNFAYDLCVQKTTPEQREQLDLSHWEAAFSGAEPVQADTIDRFAAAFAVSGFRKEAFYPCYGMAETTLMITGSDLQAAPRIQIIDEAALRQNQVVTPATHEGRAIVSCGRPAADQPLLVVNPDTRTPCKQGEVGEIWVAASGSMTQGYWNRPEQTDEVFYAFTQDEQGPFLRTGDLGFIQADELFVTGRRKELIIIRGRNYYPKDIEMTVENAHEALRPGAGAAFSIPVEGQERLVVVQEVKRTYLRNLDSDQVVKQVKRAIAEHHDLQLYGLQLIKTGSIPKTSSGKIQRFQCRSGYLDNQLVVVHSWQLAMTDPAELLIADSSETVSSRMAAPLSAGNSPRQNGAASATLSVSNASPEELQTLLSQWLAQELSMPVSEIDVTRPFAEYGLDSMAAVELTESLQTVTDQPLSPTLAYEYPTIEAVANHLGTQSDSAYPPEQTAPSDSAGDDEDLTELLNDLEGLSEAELDELLQQQGR